MKKILILIGLIIAVSVNAQLDTVNNGSVPNDGTGESLYSAFGKVNDAILKVNEHDTTKLEDAPLNSNKYARQNGSWVTINDSGILDSVFVTVTGDTIKANDILIVNNDTVNSVIPEAPITGTKYARQDGSWVTFTEGSTQDSVFVTVTGDTLKANNVLIVNNDTVTSVIDEAPIDGSQYARKDGSWEVVVTGGAEDSVFVTVTGDTVKANNILIVNADTVSSVIPESPIDGTKYARQDGNWVTFTEGGGGAADSVFVKVTGDTVLAINALIIGNDTITGADTTGKFTEDTISASNSLLVEGYEIRFDESKGLHVLETAKSGVVWEGALQDLVQIYNNSGSTFTKCTPLSFSGQTFGDSIAGATPATNLNEDLSDAFVGIAAEDILTGTWGFACMRGNIYNCNTSVYDTNELWLGNFELVDSIPPYPSRKVFGGIVIKNHATEGIIYAYPSQDYRRKFLSKSYSFTSQGIGAGTYYRGGYYFSSVSAAQLDEVSTSVTFGNVNVAYSGHAFAVSGGNGVVVGGGQVGLRVTGNTIDDNGNRVAGDADTIITDITSTSVNEYFEAVKFISQPTFELIVISGTPTSYSLDFNYGLAKYDDFENSDFYLRGIEVVGLAGVNDNLFNIELLKHSATGWTYSLAAFEAGNGAIAEWNTDLAPDDNIRSGQPFAWKRTNLSDFIEGTGSEGYVIRITATATSSVSFMDIHITTALEE